MVNLSDASALSQASAGCLGSRGIRSGRFLSNPSHADKARWMLSQVLRKQSHHDTDVYGYARLHSDVVGRAVGRPAGRIWKTLVSCGIIETSPHLAGVQSRGYRLTGESLDQPGRYARLVEPILIERVKRELERLAREKESTWLPIHYRLRESQHRLSIRPEVRMALDALPPRTRLCQSVLVGNLERGRPSFSVSDTRRVFNGLTGLSRELRKFARLGGEPICGLDLRSAQPAMLALLFHPNEPKGAQTYKSRFLAALLPPPAGASPCGVSALLDSFRLRYAGLSCDVGPDYWRFLDLVLFGDLWLALSDLCSGCGIPIPAVEDDTRQYVKRLLLRDVIAKRGHYPSEFERVFAETFPSVHRFVRWANRDHHATLVCVLQRVESWLVVENVAPKLVDRVPIVTLHDAIYCRARDRPMVRQAFEDTFDRLGIKLRVKHED